MERHVLFYSLFRHIIKYLMISLNRIDHVYVDCKNQFLYLSYKDMSECHRYQAGCAVERYCCFYL